MGKPSEKEESHEQMQRTFQCWGGDAGLVPCQERLNSSKEAHGDASEERMPQGQESIG